MQSKAGIDDDVREALAANDLDAAVEKVVRVHGREVYAFLHGVARDAVAADEAFSIFCENVWRHLPRFEFGRGSLRTWCFVVARNALHRFRELESRHARRREALGSSLIERIAADVRESTRREMPSEGSVEQLRASLGEDERALLALRVDRGLSWSEVAEVLLPEESDRTRAVARLRKQFERIKGRLRELARAAGMLGSGSG